MKAIYDLMAASDKRFTDVLIAVKGEIADETAERI
jgi:hypothetical protein